MPTPTTEHDALDHVLHDEIVERLDRIIALLEQSPIESEAGPDLIAWRAERRLRRAAYLARKLTPSLVRPEDRSPNSSELINQLREEIRVALSTDPTNPSTQPQR